MVPNPNITTENNVIKCSGVDNSWFSNHETKLSQYSQYRKPDPISFSPGIHVPKLLIIIELNYN